MRISIPLLLAVAALALTGCVGAERKLGRGFSNVTELLRGGEVRRSMEQTALFEGPDIAYSAGFIHGFNRTMARTGVGLYEILTFPFPSYDPVFMPVNPVYPTSHKPNLIADQIFSPDTSLGFGGGDVAPIIPGSRFRIFDN